MFLITGGAGFIGSNLAAALETRGAGEIIICDWLEKGDKWRNLSKREIANVIPPEHLFEFLESRSGRIDAVFHLGAVTATTETDADLVIDTNFRLPLDLWEWCSAQRVRFIYASSAATYGDGSAGFRDDNDPESLARLRPLNLYGWSKHLFDRRVLRLLRTAGIHPPQWVGLKFFNVYGPNEYHKGGMKSVAARIFPAAKAGEPSRLFKSHHPKYPDGGQMRDFVWVEDCVNVMLWLLDTPSINGLFNVGTGKARSFADLATAVYRALGNEPRIEYVDTPGEIRDKYQYFTEADMTSLTSAGYALPFTSLEEGIERYVQDFLNTPDPYR